MSPNTAIRIEGLSKRYRIGSKGGSSHFRYKSLGDTLVRTAKHPWGLWTDRNVLTEDNSFYALKDVSFDVKRGECVGIIGRNGAGKSTLLKILSQITKPTEGRIELHGRVGSLLEVGTGFHPELTGRENIYLNGAVLGMTRAEVRLRFDEIVAFSEIEKFLDTPVKQYSSGMYTRLAFSVAAHLEPEILVVDEVLAVGDAQFQKKCLGKMKDVAGEGRTVLFVSHNMGTVRELCGQGLLLEGGEMIFAGRTEDVVGHYLQGVSAAGSANAELCPSQNSPIRFLRASVTTTCGQPARLVSDPLAISLEYEVTRPLTGSAVVLSLRHGGRLIFDAFDTDQSPELHQRRAAGYYRSQLNLPPDFFVAGQLTVGVAGVFTARERFADYPDALAVDLEDESSVTHTGRDPRRQVLVQSPGKWEISFGDQ